MKKLLTVTLTLVVFIALVDNGMGQVRGGEGKAVEKKPAQPIAPAPVMKPEPYPTGPQRIIGGKGIGDGDPLQMTHPSGSPAPTEPSPQRAACEAKCRQDYQGNSAAIEACYRGCGSPEATPARQMENQPPAVPAPRTYRPGDAHYGSTPKKEVSGIESETPVKAKPPVGVEMKQPATGELKMDKASPELMKGKVLKVNKSAKTLTVMVKGKEHTLLAPDLEMLPKAGDIVEITASDAGGGGTARLVCVTVQYGTKNWCCYFFNGAPSGCGYL